MQVGVIGINHKLADLNLRETLAKICARRFGAGCAIHRDHAWVLLSTCNRTEIYFSSDDLASSHTYILNILRNDAQKEFEQMLYSFFHFDCFLHLARVTSGLDSAIVGETEIQGQVKTAYERSCSYGALPAPLHYLFQKSLKIGKQTRAKLPTGRGIPNLEHAILSTGRNLFSELGDKKILFVGASDINLKILHFLKSKELQQITLCNRTKATAEELAAKYQLKTLPWGDLHQWHDFDWVIFGTKSSEYLLTQESLPEECVSKKLVIDLCVPRNVDPQLGHNPHITLVDIDQINRMLKSRKKRMSHFVTNAETLVNASTNKQFTLFLEKRLLAKNGKDNKDYSGLSRR